MLVNGRINNLSPAGMIGMLLSALTLTTNLFPLGRTVNH